MLKAAAIRTVSWISRSVAPSARARAMCSSRTLRPLSCTRPAIASSALSFAEMGAVSGDRVAWPTTASSPR
jgi:hypothetical protein